MARKSRITEKQPPLTLRERIYKVGLYIRLSVLDSGKKDSDTLESQEDILRKFIEGKSEFSLVSVYVDNGQTGVNFERDEFERLLSDVRSGKVDCIIVKDLSRLGRNYIEVGKLTEEFFPEAKSIANVNAYIISNPVKKQWDNKDDDYFLYVGNMEKRKGNILQRVVPS